MIGLWLLGCIVRVAGFESIAGGAAPGEVYTVVRLTSSVPGSGQAPTTEELVLLRCIDEETPTGWYTTCHRILSAGEALNAAQATGQSGFAHPKRAMPTAAPGK